MLQSDMRFRRKFGALGWCTVGLACLEVVLWLSGLRSETLTFLALSSVLIALRQSVSYLWTYWDFDDEDLCERRLWRKRKVAWREVTHISQWAQNSNYLIVDHTQLEPMSDRGTIVANPEDRAGFLRTLHRFAPQARFDV